MKKITLTIIALLLISANGNAAEKNVDCSKISKFNPKYLFCNVGKAGKKVRSVIEVGSKKTKKTLSGVFNKNQ